MVCLTMSCRGQTAATGRRRRRRTTSNQGLGWWCAKPDVDVATVIQTTPVPCGSSRDEAVASPMEVDCTNTQKVTQTKSGEGGAELPPSVKQHDDLKGKQLIGALSVVYKALVKNGKPGKGTCFHSVSAPSVGIDNYLTRLQSHFQCSDTCFILSLIYVDRIVKHHPKMMINELSIHRLIATSLTLGAKFHDDVYYSNAYYAKVVGLKLKELNALEAEFLRLINWRLDVSPEEYDEYQGHVLRAHRTRDDP